MYRTMPLLILLAFLLGLWIGINPEARASVQTAWNRADEAVVALGDRLNAGLDRLFNRVSEASPPPANPPAEAKPSNVLGQLEALLQELWDGLVALWNNLVQRASNST